MLQELYISNLALIDRAQVVLGEGLNVLTGETGAGKTVVVGAVNLLLGGRADASLIRRGSSRAEVQGVFVLSDSFRADEKIEDFLDDGEDQLIIRRTISSDGKNKCYVNDRAVTVAALAALGRRLIDLHGQHEHQSLFKVASHVDFLDKYGGKELLGLRSDFRAKSENLRSLKEELDHLRSAEREMLGKKDLLQFQINEIDSAALAPDEDAELMHERDLLRNAEKLFGAVASASGALSDGAISGTTFAGAGEITPATDLVAQASAELRHVSSIDGELDDLAERLDSLLIEIGEVASQLKGYGAKLDFPPGRLQEVEDRLAQISLLKRKYGSTIAEILDYRDKASAELALCDTSEDRAQQLQAELASVEKELTVLAIAQSKARREYAARFSAEVRQELSDLNMPNAQFEVSFIREPDENGLLIENQRTKVFPTGMDKIEFLVSANKGEPPKPLAKIASGGEISRVMLALKIVLADEDEIPTLIFDEVDVGIGGKTAMSVGQKMAVLARKHQVIAVTHLPQIASYADRHFTVVKSELDSRTITEIEELLDKDRIDEMARLLSGNIASDVSLKHAEELLSEAHKQKLQN